MNRRYSMLIVIAAIGNSARMEAGPGMTILRKMYGIYQTRYAAQAEPGQPARTNYDPSKVNTLYQRVVPVRKEKDTRPVGVPQSTMFGSSKGLADILPTESGKQGPMGLQEMLTLDMGERRRPGIIQRSDIGLIQANKELAEAEAELVTMLRNRQMPPSKKASELREMINGNSEVPGLKALVQKAQSAGDRASATYFSNILNGVQAELASH